MGYSRVFTVVDSHTGGHPTRNVIGGLPVIPGKSAGEKMLYLRDHADDIRTLLMCEPRGSSIMSGTLIFPPTSEEADIGVIFIEVSGYLPMCGHDTIGVATVLAETGMVKVTEPYTHIVLETPAGLVPVVVEVRNHRAKSVTFRNAASFLLVRETAVRVPGLGTLTVDVAYGGNFCVIVDSVQARVSVVPKESSRIIAVSNAILEAVNGQLTIEHPEKPFIRGVNHVILTTPPTNPTAQGKTVVVAGPTCLDRSPCGTGMSARLAAMYAKGQVGLNEEFTSESIIGSLFRGKIVAETTVNGMPAVIPEITGTAYITGFQTLVVDPDDPFPRGFIIG